MLSIQTAFTKPVLLSSNGLAGYGPRLSARSVMLCLRFLKRAAMPVQRARNPAETA
jgi:hypothetical protein